MPHSPPSPADPTAPTSRDGAAGVPRVWAPSATTVRLHVFPPGPTAGSTAAEVVDLERTDGGWWTGVDPLRPGTDYAFVVDGGEPRPDPRSAWQPQGVHGPSRVFDTGTHRWSDDDWAGRDVRGAVVYELHVGTFTDTGTLDAAIDRLDHLVDLGIDVVELMPVAAFPGVHGWGYDGVAPYAVHDPYGGPAALQRFVDAAHRRGLAVCLDVVYNHLGPSGNYLSQFGPYFTDRHETPWGQAVNLDGPGAHAVRSYIVDNALRWLRDFHLDALRLDAVHALEDDSPRHLLAELSDAVAQLSETVGRPLSLIAESDLNDVVMVTPTREGGLGMTAQWADDVHHAVHALLTQETHGYYSDFGSLSALEKVLTGVFLHDGGWSTFRGRPWGRPVPRDTDAHRFVVFASDHDQVGNRALGDRPSERLDAGGLAIAAALVLTSPFTPMIFMGEEWGALTRWQFFTDHAEPELVESIRRGRTAEFGSHGWSELYGGHVDVPDPQDPATVEASRLDWTEPEKEGHARLLDWYRTLIALRRRDPDLAAGDLRATGVEHRDGQTWFVVVRGEVRVVVNLGEAAAQVELDEEPQILASWDASAGVVGTGVRAPGRSVTIVRPSTSSSGAAR